MWYELDDVSGRERTPGEDRKRYRIPDELHIPDYIQNTIEVFDYYQFNGPDGNGDGVYEDWLYFSASVTASALVAKYLLFGSAASSAMLVSAATTSQGALIAG